MSNGDKSNPDTRAGVDERDVRDASASTPAELLRLWRLRRDQCKHKVQKDCCVLSPMDEAPWFNIPLLTTVTVANAAFQQLVQANPQRVGIIFTLWGGGATGTAQLVPSFSDPNNSQVQVSLAVGGMRLSVSQPNVQLLQADWGPLVAMPWWAVGSTITAAITVIELVMRDWPLRPEG